MSMKAHLMDITFHTRSAFIYSSGPNNSVVLNKRVGWIFCSTFIGEKSISVEKFQSLLGEKTHVYRIFFVNEYACGHAY